MSKIELQIVTPDDTVFSGYCSLVNLPGAKGRFEVLQGHMNLISTLESGVVYITAEKEQINIKISDGIADIAPMKCVVLVEDAQILQGNVL